MLLEEILDLTKEWQKEKNVEAFEVFLFSQKGLVVQKKDQKLETFKPFREEGIGLRIIKGQKMGFSYTNSLNNDDIKQALDHALESSFLLEKDPCFSFLFPEEYPIWDPPVFQESSTEKIFQMMEDMEKGALSVDPRIKRLQEVRIKEAATTLGIVNSLGLKKTITIPSISLTVVAIAQEKEEAQMGWEWQSVLSKEWIKPQEIGQTAAFRALSRLKAQKVSSLKVPVLLPPHIGVEFLELLSVSLSGDQVVKGKSFLASKRGQKIFPSYITIIDDGLLKEGLEARPFDDEGAVQKTKILINEGKVEKFLFDNFWGKKGGEKSSGNARRSNFKTPPTVGITNLFLVPGKHSKEQLLAEPKVLEVLEVLGMHTADPISGDFSVGISGVLHQAGKSFPITGMALAGNLFDMFSKIEALGNDLTFYGNIGAPSLLLAPMDISGI